MRYTPVAPEMMRETERYEWSKVELSGLKINVEKFKMILQ